MTFLRILLGAAFVCLSCFAAGELFLRALGVTLAVQGRRFAHFITGALFVSTFVFTLCAVRQFSTWLLVAAGVVLITAWIRACRPSFRPRFSLDLPALWTALFWIPWFAFGLLYLIVAAAPDISSDGTGYHLGLVYRYYEHHGFYKIGTYMYAGLFEGIEMLYLAAFAVGKHSAAAVVHAVFLLVAPFGILAIARRVGEPRAGVLAAMLFYMSPVVGKAAASAYIDTATTVVIVGAFYFLQLWRETPSNRLLVPAALLTGFAVSAKITAASFILYAFLVVLTATAAWRFRLRQLALLSSLAALPVIPWALRNFVWFQNPVFPLFNRLFPNPYLYPILEDELRTITAHYAGVTWQHIPWQAAAGGQLQGIIGPVFLAAPLALLAWPMPAARQFLLAFAFLFLVYPANTGTRFLIPSLPFLSLAMAVAILRIPKIGTTLAAATLIAHALLSWYSLIPRWSKDYQWRIDAVDWRAALRITPERKFFAAHWPDYERGLLLDRYVAPGERVLSPNMGQMAYHGREILGFSDSSAGRRAFITYMLPVVPALGNTAYREIRFPAIETRAVRLVAASALDTDVRISEVRFFDGDHEIPRQPTWRISASPNPWEAPLAFDNIAVSWWTSGSTIKSDKDAPNTWVGVDFGEPVTVTRILVEQSGDQRWMSIVPAFPEGNGWKVKPSATSITEKPIRLSLRMETHDELWRLGIRWILMPDSQFGATDVRDHSAEWGVVQAAMANDFRLWKLSEPLSVDRQ